MVAETSEASKAKVLPVKTRARARARVEKSAENCRICNLISAKKVSSVKMSCYVIKAMDNGQCLLCVHAIRDALG